MSEQVFEVVVAFFASGVSLLATFWAVEKITRSAKDANRKWEDEIGW